MCFLCFAWLGWLHIKTCFIIILQTDTLNPFEISNGQFFGSDGFDSNTATNTNGIYMENKELYNFTASQEETKQELADLRRQVVYLQVFARLSQFSFLYKFDRILFLRLITIIAIKYFGTSHFFYNLMNRRKTHKNVDFSLVSFHFVTTTMLSLRSGWNLWRHTSTYLSCRMREKFCFLFSLIFLLTFFRMILLQTILPLRLFSFFPKRLIVYCHVVA